VSLCNVSLQTVTQIDTIIAALAFTLPTDVTPLSVDNKISTVAIANSQPITITYK